MGLTVLLILLGMYLGATQNFRFRPRSCLLPVGTL